MILENKNLIVIQGLKQALNTIEFNSISKQEIIGNPYPVPSNNRITIDLEWEEKLDWRDKITLQTSNVTIYDINGKIVDIKNDIYFEHIEWQKVKLIWDCQAVKTGIYMVKVQIGKSQQTIKVIVS